MTTKEIVLSLFHTISEKPKYGEFICVQFKSGNITSWLVSNDIMDAFSRLDVCRWAYVNELFPFWNQLNH